LDVVEYEDGLHDRGCAAWAAAQLGEDLPGLEGGDRAFAAGADLGVGLVDGLGHRGRRFGMVRPAATLTSRRRAVLIARKG
jgi:hypothetical protein